MYRLLPPFTKGSNLSPLDMAISVVITSVRTLARVDCFSPPPGKGGPRRKPSPKLERGNLWTVFHYVLCQRPTAAGFRVGLKSYPMPHYYFDLFSWKLFRLKVVVRWRSGHLVFCCFLVSFFGPGGFLPNQARACSIGRSSFSVAS